jgi:hypothetical protein
MGRLSASKCAKVAKLQHNWQNTGWQKGLFLQSGSEADTAEASELCPMGCGNFKDSLHYLWHTHNPKPNEMVRGLSGIKKWLQSNNTAPGLTSILMRITRKIIQNDLADLDHWVFNKSVDNNAQELDQLVRDQQEIGWIEMFKGRISQRWKAIQNHHLRQTIEEHVQLV